MTTIFGVRHPDVNLAVLGADRQITRSNRNGTEKYLNDRKLYISNNGLYAFGHSGTIDDNLMGLVDEMKSGKIDLGEIIKKREFEQLRNLTVKTLGRKYLDSEKQSGFLLINRDGTTTNLYKCYPLGEVEQGSFMPIGSGSGRIDEYLKALSVLNEAKSYMGKGAQITDNDIITGVADGVRYAQGKDMYSSGSDMIIMTPHDTIDCFDDLQDDFAAKIKAIQEKLRKAITAPER